jgi:hypothetical protein
MPVSIILFMVTLAMVPRERIGVVAIALRGLPSSQWRAIGL